MKTLNHTACAALLAASVLTSCSGPANNETYKTHEITGTWHYEIMSRTVQGAGADTLREVFAEDNKGIEHFYDVYRPDSILEFYVTKGDSLVAQREYRYSLRNDTIFAEDKEKKMTVHVADVTDSTLCFDYTREKNDTTYYFTTKSRRSELPEWLTKQLDKKQRPLP